MSAKKIIFILSIFVCSIIGSTFLLNTDGKTKKSNDNNTIPDITQKEIETRIRMADFGLQSDAVPATAYKTYDGLSCVEFTYPSDITENDDMSSQIIYNSTLNDGTTVDIEKPSERITFSKVYGDIYLEGNILIDISCYYKDESTDPSAHYFEENTEQVLSELLEKGIAAKAGEDFVSYIESGEIYNQPLKYYTYKYVSPGNPEIQAQIRYVGDFNEQFDLYTAEFEKTIKRK